MFGFLQWNPALSENKGPDGIISRKKPRTCLAGEGARRLFCQGASASFQAQLKAASVNEK